MEYYKGQNLAKQTTTADTFQDALTVSVDRSGESGAKDFIVIASAIYYNDSDAGDPAQVVLEIDGTEYQSPDPFETSYSSTGFSSTDFFLVFNGLKKISLSAASHTVKLRWRNQSGLGDTQAIESCSIVVMEAPVGTEYSESDGATVSGTNTGWQDKTTLTFTPGSSDDYLVIGVAETNMEDESDGDIDFLFSYDGVEDGREGGRRIGASNDDKYITIGSIKRVTLDTSSHTFKIRYKGGGTSDEAKIRRARIVAIPLSGITNYYKSTEALTNINSSSLTTVQTDTQTLSDGEHFALASLGQANESISNFSSWRFSFNGQTTTELRRYHVDGDVGEFKLGFLLVNGTVTAGSKTALVEGRAYSSSSSLEAQYINTRTIMVEIPSGGGTETATISPESLEITTNQVTAIASEVVSAPIASESLAIVTNTVTGTQQEIATATIAPIVIEVSTNTVVGSEQSVESATITPETLEIATNTVTGVVSEVASANISPETVEMVTNEVVGIQVELASAVISPGSLLVTTNEVTGSFNTELPFSDDFSSYATGSDAGENWAMVVGTHDAVVTAPGTLQIEDSKFYYRGGVHTGWTDYTAQADFYIETVGIENFHGASLDFYMQDIAGNDDYYRVLCRPNDSKIELRLRTGNTWAVLKTKTQAISLEEWHTLKITVDEEYGRIYVWFDGVQVVWNDASTYWSGTLNHNWGTIVLMMDGTNTLGYFDNISVVSSELVVATIAPSVIALTTNTVLATQTEVTTASITPVGLGLTTNVVTGVASQVENATISPQGLAITTNTVVATASEMPTANILPEQLLVLTNVVQATEIEVVSVTVNPAVLELTTNTVVGGSGSTQTASVSPIVIELVTNQVAGTQQEQVAATLSPETLAILTPLVRSIGSSVVSAVVTPGVLEITTTVTSANAQRVEQAIVEALQTLIATNTAIGDVLEVATADVEPLTLSLTTNNTQAITDLLVHSISATVRVKGITVYGSVRSKQVATQNKNNSVVAVNKKGAVQGENRSKSIRVQIK